MGAEPCARAELNRFVRVEREVEVVGEVRPGDACDDVLPPSELGVQLTSPEAVGVVQVGDAVGHAERRGAKADGIDHLIAAHALRIERIEVAQVAQCRVVVAAQAQFTPAAGQAHGRAAVEGQAATTRPAVELVVGVGGLAGAGVWIEAGFQPERRGQATTEVFRAAEAKLRAVDAIGGNRASAGQAAGRVLQAKVDDTEHRDRGLGRSHAGGCQRGQSHQGLFHASVSKVLNMLRSPEHIVYLNN